jgi:cytoskeletal protein RodZ
VFLYIKKEEVSKLKKYKWRFYRFRRKHKGWCLTLIVGLLGLFASLLVFSGLRFFYPKGIEAKSTIPVTSHHTLANKSPASSQSSKKHEVSKSSTSDVVSSSKEIPKTAASSSLQPLSPEKVETTTSIPQNSELSPVTYNTDTEDDSTRRVSQENVQKNAQAAYDEQIAQEKALQQSAEDLKASIERESPDTQVNIIRGGQ